MVLWKEESSLDQALTGYGTRSIPGLELEARAGPQSLQWGAGERRGNNACPAALGVGVHPAKGPPETRESAQGAKAWDEGTRADLAARFPPSRWEEQSGAGDVPSHNAAQARMESSKQREAARDCWGSRASVLLPSPEGRGFAIMLQRLEHSGPGEPKPAGSFGPRRHLPIQFRVRNPQRTPGFALHASSEQLRKLILQETGPTARQRLRLRSSVLSPPPHPNFKFDQVKTNHLQHSPSVASPPPHPKASSHLCKDLERR